MRMIFPLAREIEPNHGTAPCIRCSGARRAFPSGPGSGPLISEAYISGTG